MGGAKGFGFRCIATGRTGQYAAMAVFQVLGKLRGDIAGGENAPADFTFGHEELLS